MKKFLKLMLAMLLTLSLFGCKKDTNGNSYGIETGEKPENNVWNLDGTIFPLKNAITFTVLTEGYRYGTIEELQNTTDWKQLEEATNVHFNFISIGDYDSEVSRDNLQFRLMNGEYGDAIWSYALNTLSNADISELGSTGLFISLNKYMEDETIMPNFYNTMYNHSYIYNNMKTADGNIYAFAGASETNYYTIGEALMQVNSEWLNAWKTARNLDHSPATLEEFEDMLLFFRDSDLNGNGIKDEIPYMMTQGMYMGCMTVEHALGMYGIATKDSGSDMDIMIDDNGKVHYAYTLDNYKAGIKKFAEWYSNGYIYEDLFTANNETVTAIVSQAASKFGLCNICEEIAGFEPLLPPTIEGYQARYHIHPNARNVVRQSSMVITNKCEHPEILAAFMDLFYNFENNMIYKYSSKVMASNYFTENENGLLVKVEENYPTMTITDKAIFNFITTVDADTVDNWNAFKMDIDSYWSSTPNRVKGAKMYEAAGIWNPKNNIWPRLTIAEEDATDYAFKWTDVSSVVAEYRAKFVTGKLDVDTYWDEFQEKIKKLGVNEMTEIIQKTYDAYINR